MGHSINVESRDGIGGNAEAFPCVKLQTTIKEKMLASLALLLANIVCRREESCKGDGVRISTRLTLYKRETWSSSQMLVSTLHIIRERVLSQEDESDVDALRH